MREPFKQIGSDQIIQHATVKPSQPVAIGSERRQVPSIRSSTPRVSFAYDENQTIWSRGSGVVETSRVCPITPPMRMDMILPVNRILWISNSQ
jgi:hypothetical protein